MANCELSIGFNLDCKDGVGSVKRIVLTEWYIDFPQDITLNASEVLTALPANTDLYTYELPTQTASFEETINFNRDNGTVFYTQTVNVMLQKLSSAKRLELQSVATTRVVVFVQDANDNWWAVGVENGADLSTATGGTGATFGDAHGYTLAFTQESIKRAYLLSEAPSELVPA